MKMKANRYFYIKDIDCTATVEFATRKDLLDYMDEYIENSKYDWFYPDDDVFDILYTDGTEDRIDSEYDGHKVRRQHIASMIYHNACTDIVYGNFEMNECGITYPSVEEIIDDTNIKEVDNEYYSEIA